MFEMGKMRKPNYLAPLIPYLDIIENLVLIKGGALCACFSYTPRDYSSYGEGQQDYALITISHMIKRMSNEWTLYFTTERMAFSEEEVVGGENQYLDFFQYIRNQELEKIETFENHLYFYVLKKLKNPPRMESFRKEDALKEEIGIFEEELENLTASFVKLTNGKRLNDNELFSQLNYNVTLNYELYNFPSGLFFIDSFLGDSVGIDTREKYLKVGDYYTAYITFLDLPTESYNNILSECTSLPFPLRVIDRYKPLGKTKALSTIRSYMDKYFSERKSSKQLLKETMGNHQDQREDLYSLEQEGEASQALLEIARSEQTVGYFYHSVLLYDKDEENLKEKIAIVQESLNSRGFIAKNDNINRKAAYFSSMPGGYINKSGREGLLMSLPFAQFIQTSHSYSGEKINKHLVGINSKNNHPHLIGYKDDGGIFYLNLAVGDVGHTLVLGPTGSGKSTLLASLAISWLKYHNSRVVFFDKQRSIVKVVCGVGGVMYTPPEGLSFQPLRFLEKKQDFSFSLDFLCLLLDSQGMKTDYQVVKHLEAALNRFQKSEDINKRTLKRFVSTISNKEIKDALRIYSSGAHSHIFNGVISEKEEKIKDHFTVFEMNTLMNSHKSVLIPSLAYLFHIVDRSLEGRPTLLILDEAWLFLKDEYFEIKILDWLKTLRKKNVYVVFATQELEDAVKSNIFSTLKSQCMTKIYLPDITAEENMETYYKFGLNDVQIGIIKNAEMRRDYFLIQGRNSKLFSLNLTQSQLDMITVREEEKNKIEELIVESEEVRINYLLNQESHKEEGNEEVGSSNGRSSDGVEF